MSQRIRYQKTLTGTLVSRRHFTLESGIQVNVVLDLENKKYNIVDAVTGQVLASGGNTKNISVLKIQAKKGLSGMGVQFIEEKRERGGTSNTEAMSASRR